jgi:hypothetical protein
MILFVSAWPDSASMPGATLTQRDAIVGAEFVCAGTLEELDAKERLVRRPGRIDDAGRR